jgi:hypothetical protein
MYIVHKIHEQWVNGNRKSAIDELAKCDANKVREFMSYLNIEDRGTAMILALSRAERTRQGAIQACGKCDECLEGIQCRDFPLEEHS